MANGKVAEVGEAAEALQFSEVMIQAQQWMPSDTTNALLQISSQKIIDGQRCPCISHALSTSQRKIMVVIPFPTAILYSLRLPERMNT